MYEDDSDEHDHATVGAPMMVEVKGHNHTPRQLSQRSLNRDSEDEEEDR